MSIANVFISYKSFSPQILIPLRQECNYDGDSSAGITGCIKKRATPQWDLFNVSTKKHASFTVMFATGHLYFTGRNFRVFAFFGHFRENKSPRKGMTCRFEKVYPTRNVFYEKEGP